MELKNFRIRQYTEEMKNLNGIEILLEVKSNDL